MKQYEVFELLFKGEEPLGSKVNIDLKAEFDTIIEDPDDISKTDKNNKSNHYTVSVKGFYAGDNIYKIRFYPKYPGLVTWKVSGIFKTEGQEKCVKSDCANGIVRVKGLHFYYDSGKNYKPFGTTIYGMISQSEELIGKTMETLENNTFNKVRFCVFPKHYDFNHNEPMYYAFKKTEEGWDVNQPDYRFWNHLEERIVQLDKMNIQGDLILFHPYDRWGFSTMSMEANKVYLDYLLRRLAAYPNLWWSMSNEYDLFPGLSIDNWEDLTQYVTDNDPYNHLISNHNCFNYWDFSRDNITHCCIQDVNVDEVIELQDKYHKPILFDECRYEGNIIHSWGNISAREMTHRFWTAFTYGGYCTHGETFYSDDEVLWWAKGGSLKGESHKRIKFLKEIAEQIEGPLTFIREGVGALSVELLEQMKIDGVPEAFKGDFFAEHMIYMPKERMQAFLNRHREIFSHYEDKVYLRYYGKECSSIGIIRLPEDKTFTVEVIDTYEMTRTVVSNTASGEFKCKLPAKEGIAIIAIYN